MGEKPARQSLDRVDNDGNYEPANCRWVTATAQNRNRANNKLTKELVAEMRAALATSSGLEVAARFGVSRAMVSLIKSGQRWSQE